MVHRPTARPLQTILVAIGACIILLLADTAAFASQTPAASTGNDPDIRIAIEQTIDGVHQVHLTQRDGDLVYEVEWGDGRIETLLPKDFSRLLYDDHRSKPLYFNVLNITTPLGVAWVALGLIGQVLFTGRMVVQWLASERKRQSVVPVVFWWMSLGGATMLLAYFIWRKDIIGVLGQFTGWLIYVRNLYLIYFAGPNVTPIGANDIEQ